MGMGCEHWGEAGFSEHISFFVKILIFSLLKFETLKKYYHAN